LNQDKGVFLRQSRPGRTKTRESFCGSQDRVEQRQGSLSAGVKTLLKKTKESFCGSPSRESYSYSFVLPSTRPSHVPRLHYSQTSYCSRCRRRPSTQCRNPSNLLYPTISTYSDLDVRGGLWNCQLVVKTILPYAALQSLHFMPLTETWIIPATPVALSTTYSFSHTPRPSRRGHSFSQRNLTLFSTVLEKLQSPEFINLFA